MSFSKNSNLIYDSRTYSTAMASLDDQTQVRRKCTPVCSTRSLFIRIRWRHIIRKFSRTLEHFALIVRSISVFHLLSHSTRFIYRVRDTDKVSPSDTIEGVACSTDLTIYLVTPTDAEIGFF